MPHDQHSGLFHTDVERPRAAPEPTLSQRFWGIDLAGGLPRGLSSDGVQVWPGEIDRVRAFLSSECPSLMEEWLNRAPSGQVQAAKRRYLRHACDLLELRHEGRCVGVLVGAPEDWSTYYIRVVAIMRRYQQPALTRRFVRECVFAPLQRCGVERVTADGSPSNLAVARVFSDLHFYVTGHTLSDRWGPLVRYTYFLDPASEHAFHSRFAGTAPEGQRG